MLNLGESAWERATTRTRGWLGSKTGIVVVSGAGGASGILAAMTPEDLAVSIRVLIGLSAGALAAVLVVLVAQLLAVPKAAITQRDEARNRLQEIKTAKDSYSIVPARAWSIPDASGAHGDILRVEVVNEGRGAAFSVVIESIEGLSEELVDPHSHLYWMDRPGIHMEEIPPGEGRLIGVAIVTPAHVGYALTPMCAEGRRTSGRSYHFDTAVQLVVWLRVSARNAPEINYSRRIGVAINWDGPGNDLHIGLASDPEEPERREYSPLLERLLDF